MANARRSDGQRQRIKPPQCCVVRSCNSNYKNETPDFLKQKVLQEKRVSKFLPHVHVDCGREVKLL
jgi:hypothetical protein